ncbi:MAG: YdeI/OmpD-associated family protein [Myxococcota bacterium]
MSLRDFEKLQISSADDLRRWLHKNHAQQESVWLVTWKKASDGPYVPRRDVLEALLAFGWIDSVPRKLDAARTMLLVSPRQAGSNWSKVNKDIVKKLSAEGRMEMPGAVAVERSKRDGSWNRLDKVETLNIPEDLASALDGLPNAREHFDRFPPSSRRGILEWIENAKRPETRARRVAETAEKAENNIKANHPKGRDQGPTR